MEGSGVGGMGYEANVGNSSNGTMVMMMMPSPFLNSPFSPNPNRPAAIDSNENASMKALIISHPYYPRLIAAYINCRKFGAPPEVVARLEEAHTLMLLHRHERRGSLLKSNIGENPELDQFMEAYCEVLTKYQQELTNTFTEAMTTTTLCSQDQDGMSRAHAAASYMMNQLSEGDVSGNNVEIDPQAEEGDLKLNLLRKYGSYLGGLKRDFMNKRKNEKLPKKALQQLNDWWTRHLRWPYPSDLQKAALVESTGLDQKQINNWFTNQRKRHWKRSNEMQFARMQGIHSAYYNMNDGSSSSL